ncbi:MAG TPA: tRNA (adenosine(37)-N6)-threonylcarbamoyltransferase complex ATPase subunit type 1 TsaE [Sphingomicrobium sp.]
MILDDEDSTMRLGAELARRALPGDVITLSGPLGAGKTALARGFLAALGHEGEVPSPTFAMVQPYDDLDPPVWHVDLYRVEDPSELEELGLDSAVNGILLVEWPERAGSESWSGALRLSLDFGRNGDRILTAHVPPSWEGRWPPR